MRTLGILRFRKLKRPTSVGRFYFGSQAGSELDKWLKTLRNMILFG